MVETFNISANTWNCSDYLQQKWYDRFFFLYAVFITMKYWENLDNYTLVKGPKWNNAGQNYGIWYEIIPSKYNNGKPYCQFPCYQNCETRIFFSQNMSKTPVTSQTSVLCPTQKLLTRVLEVCPPTDAETVDSRPRRLSYDRHNY